MMGISGRMARSCAAISSPEELGDDQVVLHRVRLKRGERLVSVRKPGHAIAEALEQIGRKKDERFFVIEVEDVLAIATIGRRAGWSRNGWAGGGIKRSTSDSQKFGHQILCPLGGFPNLTHTLGCRVAGIEVHADQFEVPHDRPQRVVKVVRNSPGGIAQGSRRRSGFQFGTAA